MTADYQRFVNELRQIDSLQKALSLLHWDQQVLMPSGGADSRGRVIADLSEICHRRRIAPELFELVEKLDADRSLDEDARANVREAKRDLLRTRKLPVELVAKIAELETSVQQLWQEARDKNSFKIVRDGFAELLALKREMAQLLTEDGDLYTPLLDMFEAHATRQEVQVLFSSLKDPLRKLFEKVLAAPAPKNPAKTEYPLAQQEQALAYLLKQIGFSLEHGRLDRSTHPFCSTVGSGDVRLTSRYRPDGLVDSILVALHEGGHGLYEQGLRADQFGLPLGEAISLGIHESQSLLWEKQLGRSKPFWKFLFPELLRQFPQALSGVSWEEMHRFANRVERGLIRVEADELSYGLHVILRFELEQLLIDGKLEAADLPEAWNEHYEKFLGVRPPDDLTGVLQDIHWYSGWFGYFPTYLLGAVYAAQIYACFKRQVPDYENDLSRGDFSRLRNWLNEHIYVHGRRYAPKELMKVATGEAPVSSYFMNYLNDKYSALFLN